MEESFKIYVERLRDGHREKIDEIHPPDFLGINEKDLSFNKPVIVHGDAYLAEDTLILHLNIVTEATLPCAICNENTQLKIEISNFYYSQELDEIKSGIFDYSELLRETILLEIPSTIECNERNCPSRKEMDKFFSKKDSKDDENYKPFADL